MMTIYFDTSFFINLGAADDSDAAMTIDLLNRHGVRYVRSHEVFAELARRHEKAPYHAKMLDRLQTLVIAPLDLCAESDWNMLRPGSERESLSALSTELDEVDVYIRAVASAANNSGRYVEFLNHMFGPHAGELVELIHAKDPDIPVRIHNAQLRAKSPELVALLGEVQPAGDLWKNAVRVTRHNARMIQHSCVNAGIETPPLPEFDSMTPTEAAGALLDWITKVFGSDVVARVQVQHHLDGRLGTADDRALGLMGRTISENSRRRFASTLRDHAHMAVFATMSDVIDFLQIDGPRLNEIQATPQHYLRVMGLESRCFVLRDLTELPEFMADLVVRSEQKLDA